MKLLIGIPAYNEETTIGTVIDNLPKKINGIKQIDVLVVNDGSLDRTAIIAEQSGAIVLSHLLNRGLGGAIKTIFEYAKSTDYDIIVTFDADGQHSAKDIHSLIEPILSNSKDVAIGVRWNKYTNVPLEKVIVNYLANLLTFFLCGIYTRDSQSGMRAFSKEAIKTINVMTDGMEVSSEIFREINKNHLQLGEIPIQAIYTKYSKSKGQRVSDSPDVLFRLILRLLK